MITLVEFVMGHIGWVILGVLVAVAIAAGQMSIVLAVVLMIACLMVMTRFLHNANPLTPWLRERDDELTFRGCRAGVFSGPRRLYRRLPSAPRCRLCLVPFGGVGKLLGIKPSRKNPDFCTDCIEGAPVGTYEREVGVLFADIRGFTAWSEQRSPAEVTHGLTEFYALASRVLTSDDAFVELIGDQVMALYLPDFPSLGEHTCEVMVSAAERLIAEIDREHAGGVLPVGVGINFGVAAVGNVRKGKIKDFTAVGDVVNTAARLQSFARAGQIVVAEGVYERAGANRLAAAPASLALKGKSEPVRAYVIDAHRGSAGDGSGA